VMMPGLDGLDVCRILRADPLTAGVAILMLTARATEENLLLGLDLGADDYLTKPYSPRELMARARTLLRRTAPTSGTASARPVVVGELTLRPASREVRFRDEPVECTQAEFTLLELLAREPDRVFSRDQLLRHLHGVDRYVSRRTIDVHVANLRKKLDPALIRTVYGVGYALPASLVTR
jgi:two-component system alkaline phosphatase synthesis response regulator PhoP